MLILTRRVSEAIVIGDAVTVTVLGVKGNQVRLGIDGPTTISVHREEVAERIKAGTPHPGNVCRCPWDRRPGAVIPTDFDLCCLKCGKPVTSEPHGPAS